MTQRHLLTPAETQAALEKSRTPEARAKQLQTRRRNALLRYIKSDPPDRCKLACHCGVVWRYDRIDLHELPALQARLEPDGWVFVGRLGNRTGKRSKLPTHRIIHAEFVRWKSDAKSKQDGGSG